MEQLAFDGQQTVTDCRGQGLGEILTGVVEGVAPDRQAQLFAMHANLVGPAGEKLHLHEREAVTVVRLAAKRRLSPAPRRGSLRLLPQRQGGKAQAVVRVTEEVALIDL